jgi:hypothetical protein
MNLTVITILLWTIIFGGLSIFLYLLNKIQDYDVWHTHKLCDLLLVLKNIDGKIDNLREEIVKKMKEGL